MNWPLIAAAVTDEGDVVAARQRARQVAEALGFERQDQVRIATAVSEVARNALSYGGGGRIAFSVESAGPRQSMIAVVADKGPGIANLDHVLSGLYQSTTGMGIGLIGVRRLLDRVEFDTGSGGTTVTLAKDLPRGRTAFSNIEMRAVVERLIQQAPRDAFAELRQQNQELLETGELLRRQQEELRAVNQELEETNRGVLALYAELEDRATELKRANEARARFHSNVSHELRTPIQSIMALAQLMLDRADGELTAEQERQMRYIRQAGATLSTMVDDLLDLAKAEAGRLDVTPTTFRIAELFGGLRGLMRPLRPSERVELLFEADPDLPPVHADEAKLTQVLRNLVANALKFTDEGSVTVRAAWDEARDEVSFAVTDTGVGIAPEYHERVFEEFAQVPNRLQSQAKGTGLGLSLSRRLIELMGGEIRLQSGIGSGSTFTVTLPRDARAPGSATMGEPNLATAALRVLVIDDDERWRYLVAQTLAPTVREVSEAVDGESGLTRAREVRPDVILLDLAMPGRDGYAVLDELKRDPAMADIPVIVMTSSPLGEAERARLAHARLVLDKSDGARAELASRIGRLVVRP